MSHFLPCSDSTASTITCSNCYTVSTMKTEVNKQTSSHSILESQQFQVMIHSKEITIISLNTLPVTDFSSTQNLSDTHAAKGRQYQEGRGSNTQVTGLLTTYSLTIITNSHRVLMLLLLLNYYHYFVVVYLGGRWRWGEVQ